jgi:acyl-coenzyme A thioesterase PaaI-like protein
VGDEVIAHWTPEPHHEAFENILNGGIIGVILDCHANWTAAWHLMDLRGDSEPPSTVTADFHIRLRRPTPTDRELLLRARVAESADPKVRIAGSLEVDGVVTATVEGLFMAVTEGHPAFHRWD